MKPSADAAGVRILTSLDSAGSILGDAGRLQQVVWNLMSNAVKFTSKGGEVSVDLREIEGAAQITVSDTGVGIQSDALPYVFERFRQADGSITRKFGGLGLGLSIVRHIVELHGGSVTAHSQGEGQGASFVVRLPLEPVSGAVEGRRAATPATVDPPDFAGYTLLVVDDDPDARELLKRVLEDCGANVELAVDAFEALRSLRLRTPDVLLSDISMPAMDGYEFLRQVRALAGGALRDVPAIALTAFARAEDKAKASDVGYVAHVTKPMNVGEVLAVISSVLTKR